MANASETVEIGFEVIRLNTHWTCPWAVDKCRQVLPSFSCRFAFDPDLSSLINRTRLVLIEVKRKEDRIFGTCFSGFSCSKNGQIRRVRDGSCLGTAFAFVRNRWTQVRFQTIFSNWNEIIPQSVWVLNRPNYDYRDEASPIYFADCQLRVLWRSQSRRWTIQTVVWLENLEITCSNRLVILTTVSDAAVTCWGFVERLRTKGAVNGDESSYGGDDDGVGMLASLGVGSLNAESSKWTSDFYRTWVDDTVTYVY